jgi:hypothetical protein
MHQRVRNGQVAGLRLKGKAMFPTQAEARRRAPALRFAHCGLKDTGIDQGETTDARLFKTSPDGWLRRHRNHKHRVHRNSEHD